MTNDNLQDGRDLLPCPFCGGEAETDSRRSYRNITTGHMGRAVSVYCLKCNVESMICCEDQPEDSPEDLLAHLIDQWNTRAALASAEQAEPVAWMVSDAGGVLSFVTSKDVAERYASYAEWTVTPVYTRPAPSAVVEALMEQCAEWEQRAAIFAKSENEACQSIGGIIRECVSEALALIPPEAEQPRNVLDQCCDEVKSRLRYELEPPAAKNEAQALDEQAKDGA